MAEKKIRAGIDFDAMNPPAIITNPLEDGEVLNRDYPCHVHKYAPPVAGDHYTSGIYKVVNNDKEKAAALADGWSLTPVLVDPNADEATETTTETETPKKIRKPRKKKDAD